MLAAQQTPHRMHMLSQTVGETRVAIMDTAAAAPPLLRYNDFVLPAAGTRALDSIQLTRRRRESAAAAQLLRLVAGQCC